VDGDATEALRNVVVKIVLDAYEELGLADILTLHRRIETEVAAKYGDRWVCGIMTGNGSSPCFWVKGTMITVQTNVCKFSVYCASGVLGKTLGAYGRGRADVPFSTATQEETDKAKMLVEAFDGTQTCEEAISSLTRSMNESCERPWYVMIIPGAWAIDGPRIFTFIRIVTLTYEFVFISPAAVAATTK